MLIATARILLISAICSLFWVMPAVSSTGDHLLPEEGVFGFTMLNPYYESVSARLLADTRDRKCQAVMITSFKAESAVYLRYDNKNPSAPPAVVSLKLVQPLWEQMQEYFDKNKGSVLTDADAQKKALTRINSKVKRQEAKIETDVAKVLESVWEAALIRVKCDEKAGLGLDGETIHLANFTLGAGYRTGMLRSPNKGTINFELAELAKALREYPSIREANRKGASKTMLMKAQKLLARIKISK